ncbi:MAG TPA: PIN domain nuclease [Acidobacteriaceae bacterium]
MVIIDTTVWVDYFRGTPSPEALWVNRNLDVSWMGLTDVILCEVLQGVNGNARFVEVREHLSKFELFDGVGENIAVASAENYRLLRDRGITVRKTIDCFIATFCIHHDHSLLHHDRDFDPFEKHLGLRVVHP